MTHHTTNERERILELHEAAAWMDFYAAAPDPAVEQIGIQSRQIGSGVAIVAAAIDVLAHNRVIGLGLDGPVDDNVIDDLVDFYSSNGVSRFFVQLSPGALDSDLPRQLTDHGFRRYNNWMKLARGVEPPPPAKTDLQIEAINKSDAGAFGRVFVASFDWPRELVPWMAAPVGRQGWHHYLAFDGGQAVATAAMFVDGTTSWIDFASTLPAARGRGAQSALLARRISDCATMGCDLIVVETSEPTKEKPAPSFRNVQRFGFEPAYARANYIMEFGDN